MRNVSKFAMIGAFALITTASFFNYISENSVGSQATTPHPVLPRLVQVGFEKREIAIALDQVAEVDIFINSDSPLSTASVTLTYDPQAVEYLRGTGDDYVSASCMPTLKLNSLIRADNNAALGLLTLTRGADAGGRDFPRGKFCFGSALFKPKRSRTPPAATKILLDRTKGTWEATGPAGLGYEIITPPESNILLLSITPTCQYKSIGDANCDAVVDLADFEIWRRVYMRHAPRVTAADFDLNGTTELLDFEIWRRGYHSFISPTPSPSCTPMPPCMLPGANPQCAARMPDVTWCPLSPTPLVTCTPRPACLDSEPRCMLPEPATGWCAAPTPPCRPRPSCLDTEPRCEIADYPGLWCPVTPTPPIPDECTWCGTSCTDGPLPPDRMCPMVMPSPGMACKRIEGRCTPVPLTPTPSIIDECYWCGTQCLKGPPPPNLACPAVAPDPDTSCVSINKKCVVVKNTPTPALQCRWCGTFCTSSSNLINCPAVTPPAGATCIQIGNDCTMTSR